jgi:hypothetical protein
MKKYILPLACLALLWTGCDKDINDYKVPTTYDFENVSYAGQTARMDMVAEMGEYMETARTSGVVLDAARLKAMFANQGNPFTFTSTKQLKDKCFLAEQAPLEQWMDSLANASTSTVAAAHGQAGVATSLDGNEHFLLSANGFDYTEIIEKGLMGAVFYYQATGVYLTDAKIGDDVDNTLVTAGEGTDMQHHWDEAFGYLGVPKNFPTNTADARFWGEVVHERNPLLNCSKPLMDAFLHGRAAINNDDYDAKNILARTIAANWEITIAATGIHELNEAKTHLGDDALRNHEISEAIAYIRALKYNPNKKITDSELQGLIESFGTDLYAITLPTIDAARNTLAGIYGLGNVKDQL